MYVCVFVFVFVRFYIPLNLLVHLVIFVISHNERAPMHNLNMDPGS